MAARLRATREPLRRQRAERARTVEPAEPVFAFVLLGGATFGSRVRDVRLANELVRRGFSVHAWWAVDRDREAGLDPAVEEHTLFHAARFAGHLHRLLGDRLGRAVGDGTGRLLTRVFGEQRRTRWLQRRQTLVDWSVRALIREVCRGPEHDVPLMRRFARELDAARVTHVLPSLAILAPFVASARRFTRRSVENLVTFQGYELYADFARQRGLERAMYDRLRAVVADSDRPAIAVSEPYRQRIVEEIGVPLDRLHVLPPGIPFTEATSLDEARRVVAEAFPERDPHVPLVSYVGRCDAEKGLDLLLYAARMLRERGLPFQLAVCGPTSFGSGYRATCERLASVLRTPVLWSDFVSDELRTAVYRASRCVVYPSIHAEPFGMVPVEAMVQGTPCIVPDSSGVADAVARDGLRGGLVVPSWDTAALADAVEELCRDDGLWSALALDARRLARECSVERLADRLLDHLNLPRRLPRV